MEPVSKTQTIRVADVFFVGPVMVYGGLRLRASNEPLLGSTLAVLGVLTILYNGRNYLLNKGR